MNYTETIMKTKNYTCEGITWYVCYITVKPNELTVFKDSKPHTVIEHTLMVGKDWAMDVLFQFWTQNVLDTLVF